MDLLRAARRLASRLRRAGEAEIRARARRRPLWTDTVLFESFGGNGALDNPEAIFRRMLARADTAGFRFVWALGPGHRSFRNEFRGERRVRIVRYRSLSYQMALSRAAYLVNNATFPPEWGKREGQLYLNTWHGTPLKRMGYDMPNGALLSANTLRNFLSADLLLSQSAWMSERMYRQAYRLAGIYRGRILEVGYPRVDRQALDVSSAARMRELCGVQNRQFVLYAPTWTGDDFARPRDEAVELLRTVRELQHRLGDRFAVRIKAHQAVHGLLRDRAAADVLIDNDIPTNQILGIADHLVTDFSSIFFDYLSRDRPITFYVPAESTYRSERGAYLSEDELPGPTCRTLDELAARIREPRDTHADRRARCARIFAPDVDAGAADRVIDGLLTPHPLTDAPSSRRSVLIYLGGMRSNGITSSGLNLLAALDHERWDVTALMGRPRGSQLQNQALIDPRVRQLFRMDGMNGTKLELLRALRPSSTAEIEQTSPAEARLWADEWRRIMGDARFDVVVDFSGYSRFWAELLLQAPDARRLIWLHNDMAAELHRTGGGRSPVHRSLPRVLRALPRFDALVSVSPRLSDLNRRNLADRYRIPPDRFLAARNVIDHRRIRAAAAVPIRDLPEFAPPMAPDPDALPSWLEALSDPGLFWFISVGRLSPEKNQGRLIAAFQLVHEQLPQTRLLLVGNGPLRDRLHADIVSRGLSAAAVIAGRVGNPFPLLAAANVFVLSSDYEGQPMVLLEAATLGIPVITTDFSSSGDALPAGYATVVPMTAEALADAMASSVSHPVRPITFDPIRYNRDVLRATEAALRGGSVSSDSDSSAIRSPTSDRSTTDPQTAASTTRTATATANPTHMSVSDPADP